LTVDLNPDPVAEDPRTPDFGQIWGFVTKLGADGSYLWSKTFEGGGMGWMKLRSAPDGSIVVAGSFVGSVDFDPGAASAVQTSSSELHEDAYLVALDSDGQYLWSHAHGADFRDVISSVYVTDDTVFAAGVFTGAVDFDPGSGVDERTSTGYDYPTNLTNDYFVTMVGLDGSYKGTYTWGTEYSEAFGDPNNFSVAGGDGFVVFAGYALEGLDFNPGPGSDLWGGDIEGAPLFVTKSFLP
jgi:hypothetical protein